MALYDVSTSEKKASPELIAGGTLYAAAPVGTILPFGGNNIPSGWGLCDGTAVSRTTYAELFAVIGTSFGAGDGSTTFNLPDMRESVPKGAGLTGKTVGAHLDADGLAVGEFLDDRVQEHTHNISTSGNTAYSYLQAGTAHAYSFNVSNINSRPLMATSIETGRSGATTEVKSVGVNYIICMVQTALPADFLAKVEDAITLSLLRPILLPAGQYNMDCTISKEGNSIWGSVIFLPFTIDSNVIITSSLYRPAGQDTVKETNPTIHTVGNQVYVTTNNSSFDSYVGKDGVFRFNISYT